ncbi:DsbA family protein [Mycolicibacterium thermoresistibile]
MRWLTVTAMLGIAVLTSACTVTVDGTAAAPDDAPGAATVVAAADGYGVQLGYQFAPAQIEIYIEPLCPACARLERRYGRDLSRAIDRDELRVTYRPLTFLDRSDGYSKRVSNALFAAADPEAATDATDVQQFLEDAYRQLSPVGDTLDAEELAAVAEDADLPESVVDRIAANEPVVDVDAMDAFNSERFEELTGKRPYTPMVWDLVAQTEVEVNNPDWVAEVVEGS